MLSDPVILAQVDLWVRLLRNESEVATFLQNHAKSDSTALDYAELRRRLMAAANAMLSGQ